MTEKTKIEWCDASWNIVTGCTPCAVGCQNCYAKRMATRLAGRFGYPKDEPFRVKFHPDRLDEPLRWKKARRVFVCSMGDLFHEQVGQSVLEQIWGTMARTLLHTYLVLTKRPERMAKLVPDLTGGVLMARGLGHFATARSHLPHLWLGASVSTQADADRNIPHLLRCPAALRFVSVEPILEDINLELTRGWTPNILLAGSERDPAQYIDWVIVGCESGPRRRPCELDWIRHIRDQCVAAGIPLFVKQADIHGRLVKMPKIDGRVWDQFLESRT